VGIVFVKTLAYATGCALVGVPSLDVLAQNALLPEAASLLSGGGSVGVVVDAKRARVYCGVYAIKQGVVEREGEMQLLSPAEMLQHLQRPALLIGDGTSSYRDEFAGEGLRLGPENLWIARASVVARLGLAAYRAGRRENVLEFAPIYLRVPEAEEVRLRKMGTESGASRDK
jgi:tRNA threonylcarbamoyl adenosine modification protein YeaZ